MRASDQRISDWAKDSSCDWNEIFRGKSDIGLQDAIYLMTALDALDYPIDHDMLFHIRKEQEERDRSVYGAVCDMN